LIRITLPHHALTRQFHGRPQSLGENATSRDPKNDEHIHVGMIAGSRAIALIDNFLPDH